MQADASATTSMKAAMQGEEIVAAPKPPRLSGAMPFWVAAFVLSGIASPMIITEVRIEYQPPAITLWPLYALYLGNLIAGAFGPSVPVKQWIEVSRVFILDVAGQGLAIGGLLLTGPPVFVILYQSVTIFTGLFALAVLPLASHPSGLQWYAMFIITVGLAIQGLDTLHKVSLTDPTEVKGMGAIFVSCVFFAGAAVASELYIGSPGRGGAQPLQAAWIFGVEGCLAASAWAAATLHGSNVAFIRSPGFLVLFGTLVLSNAAHQAAWFNLVGSLGACSTAVIKALQNVFLFVSAGMAFCGRDADQCLTRSRMFSLCIVVLGVLAFSFNSRDAIAARAAARAAAAGCKPLPTETTRLRAGP
eukprot:TRINITY_DN75296_c0_g1_i1.p1 TRINITY_DN75296_c0_g1~~TRINITY_DN75296_c0_g1_i1.p1  ORF type:complete len:360 (-),score=79.26 TRINITY_DN75296_c0_g1_i1:159-1238(-)